MNETQLGVSLWGHAHVVTACAKNQLQGCNVTRMKNLKGAA